MKILWQLIILKTKRKTKKTIMDPNAPEHDICINKNTNTGYMIMIRKLRLTIIRWGDLQLRPNLMRAKTVLTSTTIERGADLVLWCAACGRDREDRGVWIRIWIRSFS
jgi:hypothetical protein